MSKIKAVILDFDGVIVESMDIKARAFAHLFRQYPEHIENIVKLHMEHGGLSRFEKFGMIYRDFLNKTLTVDQNEELGREFADYVKQQVVICPYVKGAVEFLEKYYKMFCLFIVSGTPQEELRSIIRMRGIEKYFKEVLGAPEHKDVLNRKILEKYGFKPEEAVFVGDTIDDWNGIEGTGIRFIGRLTGEGNPFKEKEPDALITDLFGLSDVIDREYV